MWQSVARGGWKFWALLIGCLALAAPAGATPFALDGAVVFNNSSLGLSGQVLPVLSENGPSSCLTAAATCQDPTSQDWFIFRIQLFTAGNALNALGTDSAPIDEITGSVIGVTPVGAGFFNDSGTTPTTGGLVSGSGDYRFGFGSVNASNLKAGEVSDRLFVSYTTGSLPGNGLFGTFPAGTVSFMIAQAGGISFSPVQGAVVLPIPEPSTLALLALGCAGIAALGSRLRRRA